MQFLAAFAVFYLLTIFFFNGVVFEPNNLAISPDYLSGKMLNETLDGLLQEGPPLWSPYYFGGMPGQAALHFPVYTYTFFNWKIVDGIISLLFLNPGMEFSLRLMLFHLLMAGCFAYLLGRTLGLSWIASVFAGIIYMFTPQLIVLPGVGHGSKLFTAAYIPLVLLTTIRLLRSLKPLDLALFVLAVGMTLLSIHVQMAYYALITAGMYLLWNCIFDIKLKPGRIPLKIGVFAVGVILGIGFAASSYFPVYEYTPFSIRGGTEGGLAWDYATNWSFHPLESLTYFVPSFFGFGGQTYWGYMPFTDMPLYWGAAAFALAVIGASIARSRKVTFFIIVFFFAWIVSFGKFFPVLYKPMFALFPYFNKFRVPVMIQILLVMSVSVLAGFGLDKLKELAGSKKLAKRILYGAAAIIGIAIIVSLLYSPCKSAVGSWIAANRPQIPAQAHGQLFSLLFGDLWKTAAFAGLTLGTVYLFIKKSLKFNVLAVTIIALLVIDLWIINLNLVNTQPRSAMDSIFRPTPAVNFLQKQEKPFRIYPADNVRPQNWYGYFGLQSIDGYMGTKMIRYQELLDGIGLTNINVLNMLNTRYILTDRDLSTFPGFVLVMDGQQKIFRNNMAFPRAWLVNKLISLPNKEDRFAYMKNFDPGSEAIVETPLKLAPGTGGTVNILHYSPLKIELASSAETESFLVLSEVYYPPSWKAEIDGAETEIHPANHLLRGVIVPAGEHKIVFNCESSVFNLGWMVHWIVFALVTLTLAFYTVLPFVRRKR